jgi:hypothetical protein
LLPNCVSSSTPHIAVRLIGFDVVFTWRLESRLFFNCGCWTCAIATRYPGYSVAVEVGGAAVSVAVGGWVEVGVSLGTGVSVSVGVSVSRMKGVKFCVAVGPGVKLGVWLGGTNPVFVIVGVCVMVAVSGVVSGVLYCGVSEAGMLVGDCVGVNRPGACRSAVNPAQ